MNYIQQAADKSAEPETELANEASRLVDEITASSAAAMSTDRSQPTEISTTEASSSKIDEVGGDHVPPSNEGEPEIERTLSEPGVKLEGKIGEASESHRQTDGEPCTEEPDDSEGYESTITPATHIKAESTQEAIAEANALEVVGEAMSEKTSAPNQIESSLGPLNVGASLTHPTEQSALQPSPGTDHVCEAQNRTAEETHDAAGQPAHPDLEAQPAFEHASEAPHMIDKLSKDTVTTSVAAKPPLPPEVMSESRQHQDSLSETETLPSGMEEVSCTVAGGGHILPPDSPRTGHLFILKPTMSPEGDVEIERTLLEPGVKVTDKDDESKEFPAEHEHPDEAKQEEQKRISEESGPTCAVEETSTGGEKGEKSGVDAVPTEDATPRTHVEPSLEPLQVEASLEQKTDAGLPMADVRVSAPSPPRPPPPKVTRTQTLPSPTEREKKSKGFGANMPWQKKRASDDSEVQHERAEHQHKGGANPFSGMLKSLRRSIKKVGGSGSVSHEEPSKVRIQSKSSTGRPSPRIVSSLVILPPENNAAVHAAVEDPETPITRKRRLMEEITDNLLVAMPPSPTDPDGVSAASNRVHANVAAVDMAASPPVSAKNCEPSAMTTADSETAAVSPDSTLKGEVAMEGEIEPVCAKNPAQVALAQRIRQNQAQNILFSLQTNPPGTEEVGPGEQSEKAEPAADGLHRVPPPRPVCPPLVTTAQTKVHTPRVDMSHSPGQAKIPTSPTHHLPPPPRPSEPPLVSHDARITCRTTSAVSALPPVSVNSTVFTPIVKTKALKATDGHEVEKRTTKLKYQRTESFDWPFGGKNKEHKSKTVEPTVTRPQLESPPPGIVRGEPLKALVRASGDEIVNESCHLQASSPVQSGMSLPANMVSVGVQVAPTRPDGLLFSPVTSLKHEASPTTLLQKAMEARTTPQRPVSFFKEEFYNQCIKGLFKVECIREENGFQLPYISDRLSGWGSQKMTDLLTDRPQEGQTEERNGEPAAGAETPHEGSGEGQENTVSGPHQALQLLHPFLFSMQGKRNSRTADQQDCPSDFLVHCLRQYVAACVRLKDYDLQGEFGAFHWITGDLLKSGWSPRGCPEGWPTLRVFFDPVKRIDFVQLPPLKLAAGSLIYPNRTLDAMLTGWLDTRSTVIDSGSDSEWVERPPSLLDNEFLHPALAIMRLSDLLPEIASSLLASLSLAVLLSADYCSHRMPKCTEADLGLDFRPEQILFLSTPSNCMVIFRLQQVTADEANSIVQLLRVLGLEQCQNLAEALDECVKGLSSCVLSTPDFLPNLIRALSPPDWMALAISRITLLHAKKGV
uniref:Uncharacterized protein n=1 Tax=Schistocephalus solidus TaxID=70667 RepID=A0A0X3NWV8_SCHSO